MAQVFRPGVAQVFRPAIDCETIDMETANPLEARVSKRLAEWEAAGLLRVLRPPTGIDFSSNDYLNLSTHPLVVERLARAVAREGCGSTGSRLLRGDRDAFTAIERRFAD